LSGHGCNLLALLSRVLLVREFANPVGRSPVSQLNRPPLLAILLAQALLQRDHPQANPLPHRALQSIRTKQDRSDFYICDIPTSLRPTAPEVRAAKSSSS